MPFFAMIGRDGPRGLELRKLHREAHLANLEGLEAAGKIRHAGPLIGSEDGPVGSIILFEADDLESAQAFASGDPYVVEGIFQSWEVFETKVVFPRTG